MVAGLTNNERSRLKNIGQPIRAGLATNSSSSTNGGQSSIANLGWAGAGADLLGKKRREEEKRKMMEEKRKVRELMTDVGSKDWRSSAVQAEAHLSGLKEKLPKCEFFAFGLQFGYSIRFWMERLIWEGGFLRLLISYSTSHLERHGGSTML